MAHIICTAETVESAAIAVLQHIKETRDARDEKAIMRVMAKRRHFWKFWDKSTYSREGAIKWLDGSDSWGWRSMYAYKDEVKAKQLLLLAKHGDPVTIDAESAQILWG